MKVQTCVKVLRKFDERDEFDQNQRNSYRKKIQVI